MTASQEQGGSAAGGRQAFLSALVAGFVPLLGLPVVWGLAALGRKREPSPLYQRWYRRLVALAILDTVVAAAFFSMTLTTWRNMGRPPPPLAPPKALGAVVDPNHPGPGLRFLQVDERGPAAAAGLQGGDVVLHAQGQPVDSIQALRDVLQAAPAGGTVQLEVAREGARREVGVVPVEASSLAPPARGLFEPQPSGEPVLARDVWRGGLGTVLAAVALLVLWAVGRRRGADARPLFVLGVLGVSGLGALATSRGLAALLGGPSRGTALLTVSVNALLLLLVAAVLVRRGAPEAPSPEARGWLGIYFASLGLLVTLGMRTLILMSWFSQVFAASPEQSQHPMMEMARQGPLGAAGWVLLAVPVVLLAPVGEELLFRGVLLPWLSGWMGHVAALTVSAGVFASLHLFYGVFTGWILFLGLLLGWARLASGGLRAPILLHVTINGTALLMLARSLTG
ncbi:type II CAAX prenyl endopeptidase Rce1 family protein [Hyalangium sp.]|uniref:CPBP family glutamic-type intramembrane protease n=1 Tax=Hyalangium sp. TaxID=2028555 RepID=UPI002D6FAFDD|nr:CPBP family glutamic-type intramembrane protease [Hyalangium sp.]HYH99187.1 CPBP family glutamic-type intramembrane protease [Hyalangium sp.]